MAYTGWSSTTEITPKEIAKAVGVGEKQFRQWLRDNTEKLGIIHVKSDHYFFTSEQADHFYTEYRRTHET